MGVMEILTEEFLSELPDDPQAAFGMVLRRADAYVVEALKLEETDSTNWRIRETAQHTAMNTVIAVAKRYEIQPFASIVVPPRKGFGSEQFNEFKVDLDHYAAQLVLDNSIRNKRDAVAIEPKVKDRLRQHVYGIKTLIDQADMPEPRRALLHKRIAAFEAALEKSRVNVVMLAGAVVAILAGANDVAGLADSPTMHKLVATIMVTIGEAKAIDEAKRELPPVQPPQPLLPPRPADYIAGPPKARRDTAAGDLNDDIPFSSRAILGPGPPQPSLPLGSTATRSTTSTALHFHAPPRANAIYLVLKGFVGDVPLSQHVYANSKSKLSYTCRTRPEMGELWTRSQRGFAA